MRVVDPIRYRINGMRHWLGRRNMICAARNPSFTLLSKMRTRLGIQLNADELSLISKAITYRHQPNVLIYGTGKDSEYWYRLNKDGFTQFLEDDLTWIQLAAKVVPQLSIASIEYNTHRRDWRKLIEQEKRLGQGIPERVKRIAWNVILVDAPCGHDDDSPGRMKSIYQASIMGTKGADVFVHDCDRQVEAAFCDRYLKSERLISQVGRLRHYRL